MLICAVPAPVEPIPSPKHSPKALPMVLPKSSPKPAKLSQSPQQSSRVDEASSPFKEAETASPRDKVKVVELDHSPKATPKESAKRSPRDKVKVVELDQKPNPAALFADIQSRRIATPRQGAQKEKEVPQADTQTAEEDALSLDISDTTAGEDDEFVTPRDSEEIVRQQLPVVVPAKSPETVPPATDLLAQIQARRIATPRQWQAEVAAAVEHVAADAEQAVVALPRSSPRKSTGSKTPAKTPKDVPPPTDLLAEIQARRIATPRQWQAEVAAAVEHVAADADEEVVAALCKSTGKKTPAKTPQDVPPPTDLLAEIQARRMATPRQWQAEVSAAVEHVAADVEQAVVASPRSSPRKSTGKKTPAKTPETVPPATDLLAQIQARRIATPRQWQAEVAAAVEHVAADADEEVVAALRKSTGKKTPAKTPKDVPPPTDLLAEIQARRVATPKQWQAEVAAAVEHVAADAEEVAAADEVPAQEESAQIGSKIVLGPATLKRKASTPGAQSPASGSASKSVRSSTGNKAPAKSPENVPPPTDLLAQIQARRVATPKQCASDEAAAEDSPPSIGAVSPAAAAPATSAAAPIGGLEPSSSSRKRKAATPAADAEQAVVASPRSSPRKSTGKKTKKSAEEPAAVVEVEEPEQADESAEEEDDDDVQIWHLTKGQLQVRTCLGLAERCTVMLQWACD
jgi:hypothetical protein